MPSVAPHSRTLAAASFGKCLAKAVSDRTWDATLRVLLFPKFVLQAPRHGGKRYAHLNRQRVCDRALSICVLTIPEIWADVVTSVPPKRPRRSTRLSQGRKRSRAVPSWPSSDENLGVEDPESMIGADADTLTRVRTLVAEGAPSKALKTLLSEGMHDTDASQDGPRHKSLSSCARTSPSR